MTSLPPDRYLYEYCLLRYVPHIERGECVNVGLIMMCKLQRWLKGQIHLDAARLRPSTPRWICRLSAASSACSR